MAYVFGTSEMLAANYNNTCERKTKHNLMGIISKVPDIYCVSFMSFQCLLAKIEEYRVATTDQGDKTTSL